MNASFIAVLLISLAATTTVIASSSIALNLQITDDSLTLSWSPGKPSYQVQAKANLAEAWSNVGDPTTNLVVALPLADGRRFFRVVQDFTARYQVVFEASWSATTHPYDFPASAHWSGLVGGVHSDSVRFWREGERASLGIQLMAERGRQSNLLTEVQSAVDSGTAHFGLSGGGIGTSPGNVHLVFPRAMSRDFPLVTLCSMIAPSPDWFVGVDGLSLIEDDQWVSSKTAVLFGYDAGTDSGPTFTSPDLVSDPRGPITRFAGFPALVNGEVVPFGTFTFTRLDP